MTGKVKQGGTLPGWFFQPTCLKKSHAIFRSLLQSIGSSWCETKHLDYSHSLRRISAGAEIDNGYNNKSRSKPS